MTRKTYIQPLTETVEAGNGESLMKWVSTPFSDEPIEDDDFNVKQGFFDEEDENWGKQGVRVWED